MGELPKEAEKEGEGRKLNDILKCIPARRLQVQPYYPVQ